MIAAVVTMTTPIPAFALRVANDDFKTEILKQNRDCLRPGADHTPGGT